MKQTARFPAVGPSVLAARQFVYNNVTGIPRELADALVVIASELASNCVRHGATTFEIRVDQTPEQIRIEAEDDGAGEPVLRSPGPHETSGRGLQIIRVLANAWGVEREPGAKSKTVWATLSVPGAREHALGSARLETPASAGASSKNRLMQAVRANFARSTRSWPKPAAAPASGSVVGTEGRLRLGRSWEAHLARM